MSSAPAIEHETGEDDVPQIIMPRPIRDEHPTRCASPACPDLSRLRGPLGESDRDDPPKAS
jgi:hypothetical protein